LVSGEKEKQTNFFTQSSLVIFDSFPGTEKLIYLADSLHPLLLSENQ